MGRKGRTIVCVNVFQDGGDRASRERLTALWLRLILRKEQERHGGLNGEESAR